MTETELGRREAVMAALRRLRGRATVGDVAAATGLVRHDAEDTLRSLLATHRGHLEVGERGDLVWAFDPRLLTRDHVPWTTRFRRRAGRILRGAFKVWITATLLVYFVLFLVLAIAAVVAVFARGGGDRDFDLRGGRHFRLEWLWFLFWTPDWRWGAPYYGERYRLHGRKRRVPFYRKVFAFVFGPDEPARTAEQRDREHVTLIRARGGVLTATDMMIHTGATPEDAHEELGRLLAAFEGDARATPEGEVVYVFPELMVSARGRVDAEPPPPAWRRLLPDRPLTGNSTGANVAIAGINLFNLAGAVAAATVLMPALAVSGPLAWALLVWAPLAFSAIFFGIPAVRAWRVGRENARRRSENIRRILLGRITEASLAAREVSRPELTDAVSEGLGEAVDEDAFERILRRLVGDFDGAVRVDAEGRAWYAFPALRRSIEAGAAVRSAERLQEARVGTIVHSSADDPLEAARRELETFDLDYGRQLDAARVGWEDPADLLEQGAAPEVPPPPRRASRSGRRG